MSCQAAQLVARPGGGLAVWWAPSSAAKIRLDSPAPSGNPGPVQIHCARNEWEAAQIVFNSQISCPVSIEPAALTNTAGQEFPPSQFEVLQALFLKTTQPSDRSTAPGLWPDPLVKVHAPVLLTPGSNTVFWLRVHVPVNASPGTYRGALRVSAGPESLSIPVELTVFSFALPDRMTCQTAFGFSPQEVFRYHRLTTDAQKREVLDKYFANLSAHHISPYDPVPLDRIKVTWPDVKPPASIYDQWTGERMVTNEVHTGRGALLIYDDRPTENVTVVYDPLIAIPGGGLHFTAWTRTAVPGHRFLVTFNHYDSQKKWISGANRDVVVAGNGAWQPVEVMLTNSPPAARYVRLHLRATTWTDAGERLGLVWMDDLSLKGIVDGREYLNGNGFEPEVRTEPVASVETLKARLDFAAWDRAMEKAMKLWHFNSFQVDIPGLGGGTFHELSEPRLLGFGERDPEYSLLLSSYATQMETHLRERGWLESSYVYWFDEPSPDQYGYVMNGFNKLKKLCPGIPRMLTEQVEPGLIGGPNIWCPISNEHEVESARRQQRAGDRFWWYVCTGPKAPYAGLFIDHPGPEMRVWVWQAWQRQIQGLLVWTINYWNSSTAYPDRPSPQDPYADPMSWQSGYGTPSGERRPWGNGDGRFIYPPMPSPTAPGPVLDGPVDSIRWEHLRDGIEDYEYFSILRQRLDNSKLPGARVAELRKLLVVPGTVSRSLTEFTRDGLPMESHRRALAAAIQELN